MTDTFANAPGVADDEDDFNIAILMLSQSIKEFGARSLWSELRRGYPAQYKELLFYALEMLPK